MEFMGYVRPDGKVGARNYVAVIPSVTCANDVANAICHQVQGTITYLHHQGCCQMPPDLERVTDTLISLGMSPNVGAILIVSLGCEGTDHERMYKELSATGKHVEIIHIQELGGVSKAIQLGTDIARKLVIEISGLQRQPVDVSKIVMAIKCGASDTTSGMASNCVIGYVADKLAKLHFHDILKLLPFSALYLHRNRFLQKELLQKSNLYFEYFAYHGLLNHHNLWPVICLLRPQHTAGPAKQFWKNLSCLTRLD